MGALMHHVTGGHLAADGGSFQPMNVNFGLFPDISDFEKNDPVTGRRYRGKDKGRSKKRAMSARALDDLGTWLEGQSAPVTA